MHLSYAKYKAFLAALPVLDKKWKDGELPYDHKPTQEHVIETMQSKTFWYTYIRKYFPCVSEYGDMVAWLEGGEDASSDIEVWGVEKGQYGFGDLDLYLKRGGVGLVSEEELERKKKSTKGKEKASKEGSGSRHKGNGKVKVKGKEKIRSPKKSQK